MMTLVGVGRVSRGQPRSYPNGPECQRGNLSMHIMRKSNQILQGHQTILDEIFTGFTTPCTLAKKIFDTDDLFAVANLLVKLRTSACTTNKARHIVVLQYSTWKCCTGLQRSIFSGPVYLTIIDL